MGKILIFIVGFTPYFLGLGVNRLILDGLSEPKMILYSVLFYVFWACFGFAVSWGSTGRRRLVAALSHGPALLFLVRGAIAMLRPIPEAVLCVEMFFLPGMKLKFVLSPLLDPRSQFLSRPMATYLCILVLMLGAFFLGSLLRRLWDNMRFSKAADGTDQT